MWRVLFLLLVSPIFAQELPPIPPDVFAEGVEIVSVEVREEDIYYDAPVILDINTRTIITSDRRIFPLPNELQYGELWTRSMLVGDVFYFEGAIGPYSDPVLWSLNVKSGEITRHESLNINTACGSYELKNLQKLWTLVETNGKTYPCHHVSGMIDESLPTSYVWETEIIEIIENTETLTINLLLLQGLEAGKRHLFTYDLDVQQLVRLRGEIPPIISYPLTWDFHENVMVFSTVDRQRFVIADLQRGDTTIFPSEDVQSEIWYVGGNIGALTINDKGECDQTTYTTQSREITTHEFGTLCYPEYGNPFNTAYYRDGQSLVAYNAVTDRREELYQGEIEGIHWISEDEQYALLAVDDNGIIDSVPGQESSEYNQFDLSLIDLISDTPIVTIPRTDLGYDYCTFEVETLTPDMIQLGVSYQTIECPIWLIKFGREAKAIEIPDPITEHVQGDWWIIESRSQDFDKSEPYVNLDFYNIGTGESRDFVNTLEFTAFVSAELLGNGLLKVTFTEYHTLPGKIRYTIYTVRVNGL